MKGNTFGSPGESSDISLGDYLDYWLRMHGEDNLEASTLSQYRGVIRRDILPILGDTDLGKLTALDVLRVMREKSRAGFAPSTVKRIHVILRRALGHAVGWGLLERNPASSVEPPSGRPVGGVSILEPHSIPRYLEAAFSLRHYPVLFTAIYTGMRQGELLALRWSDISGSAVSVRRALKRTARGRLYFGGPKTRSAQRLVPLSGANVRVLERWRKVRDAEGRCGDVPIEERDLVFTSSSGRVIGPRNLLRSHYKALERADLPGMPFHALRHTHATMLLRAGVHPKVVSERLGHSSVRVTLDTYSHVLPSLQWELADRLDDLLDGE